MIKAINIPRNDFPSFSSSCGNLFNNSFEPSNGGTGIRLNKAKKILIYAMSPNGKDKNGKIENLINNPRIKAIKRLDPGPAKETQIMPCF